MFSNWHKTYLRFLAIFILSILCISNNGYLSTGKIAKSATTFQIQTGYYLGNGTAQSITGIGFQPSLVIIKSDTNAGSAVLKTSGMPAPNTAYFTATADNTASQVVLDVDGFSLGNLAAVNSSNVRYTYIAFGDSDCTVEGDFCTGIYIGDGASPKKINTGFQPDLVLVKRSGTSANWRSSLMLDNYGQYFDATVQNTAGALFTTLVSDGFNVGATNNANLGIYYYAAFKNVPGKANVGSYVGDAVDNRNITGIGFQPDFIWAKNAETAVTGVLNTPMSYGDYSGLFTATANAVNQIQELQSDGFQVGSAANVNGNTNTIHWAAFAGVPAPTSSGSYQMMSGTYTGTGAGFSINGLGFSPDLIIIKNNNQVTNQYAVFRTGLMAGDRTAYLANAVADFVGGITSIDPDGFSLGTHASVNTAGDTYYWTVFGNAWDPRTNSGASDFVMGAYTGNGIDNRDITGVPWQPDLVIIKRSGASAGAWRTSQIIGDYSLFFSATAGLADYIQDLKPDSFEIGTNAAVNTAGGVNWWFAFKNGNNFTVNSYTGTGLSQNITSVGFSPDLLWVKPATLATRGVLRTGVQAGDAAQPFTNAATITNAITALIVNGFSIGTAAETNSNSVLYHYSAWHIPDTTPPTVTEVTPVPNPTTDPTPDYVFNTTEAGTITFGGDCSSPTTTATIGNNTTTFSTLADGVHNNCTITITDAANNTSTALSISSFTVDTTPPTVTQVTPVPNPTNDTTPDYVFNTTEAGTITFGGDCSSPTTTATIGNNTTTFSTLADGVHNNCTITITDALNNTSTALSISSFTVDTAPPDNPVANPAGGTYTSTQSVALSSNGSTQIRYTQDGSVPGCSVGTIYINPISINSSRTIKAIGCDAAGNFSGVVTYGYTINQAGGGGGGGGGGGSFTPTIPSVSTQNQARLNRIAALPVSVHSLVKLADDGNPDTQSDTAVYYVGADGYRHAFPNEKAYFTWYCDYSRVMIITAEQMAGIPLGPNVIYRPGVRMVKFRSTPTVYVVARYGVLRPITSEPIAAAIYGTDWNTKIDDIADTFFNNYSIGLPITDQSQFVPSAESITVDNVSDNYTIVGYVPSLFGTPLICPIKTTTPAQDGWPFSFAKTYRFTTDLYPFNTDTTANRNLQEFLTEQGSGIYNGGVTGSYGVVTTEGVRNFQAKYNISQTGNVGPLTRARINQMLAEY